MGNIMRGVLPATIRLAIQQAGRLCLLNQFLNVGMWYDTGRLAPPLGVSKLLLSPS